MHKAYRFCLPLPISVTVSIFTVSAFIFLTFIPNIPILTVIPQHIIISSIHCTGYTTHLKTLHSHIWWDALPCHYDLHWLNNTFMFLGLQLTWMYEDSQFSPQMVVMVLRILNMCFQDFYVVSVVYSVLSSCFFLWFLICGLMQVLFLSLVVNFLLAIFLLLPLD